MNSSLNVDRFIPWMEAAEIRGARGKNPAYSTMRWVERWNTKHPKGNPLHVYRKYGSVEENSFRAALREACYDK
jgi:hypothetical protein